MGQANDKADAVAKVDEMPGEEASGLRRAAVAIDPPPRGALGIRELLDLLEKEVGRKFPAGAADRRDGRRRAAGPARKRA